jgi:membrane protein involved in colicin uptake
MAFGFNDFASFFDPVSDLLGTSGKKGVGLLQQKPEDIALTAAAVYLATNGIPITPETLAAAAPGTAETAAAEAATQEAARVAAEQAAAQEAARVAAEQEAARVAAEQAAQESARQGILQANQYVPGGQLGPTAEEYRNLAENTARYPSGGPYKESVGNYGLNYTKPITPEMGTGFFYVL